MKAFLRSFFASLLALVVVIFIIFGVVGSKSAKKPIIKDHSYLVVDIYGEIPAYDAPGGIMGEVLGGDSETLHRILSNLEKAAADKRIEGVIVKVSSSNTLGTAMAEEIRGALKKVRESGKPVYAFGDTFDRKTVYLASACDSIFMPPAGYMVFTGMGGSANFIKKTLDKLGIKPNLHQIREYKSAAEMMTRTESSPEAREMRQWMADEMWDMQIGAISEDRKLSEEKIVELMRHALFTPKEAAEAGLIDRVLYWDELENRLKGDKDEKLRTVTQSNYAKIDRAKVGLKGKKKIAVVHAHGMIGGRQSRVDPLLGMMMGHETVSADLRRARMDKDIAAVVFRVDSRGGEGLASDLISREVQATAAVKPVVVSMIDVAASGGYMISYRASKIVADPMTITGSIGSINAKLNMAGLYDKLGITWDDFEKGPNGLLYSDHQDFTEEQRARFEDNHWDGFNEWFYDVAKHRGIPADQLEKLAMGRVWTGRQAKENKLIDEVGGLDKAIAVAKELAGIPADQQVTLLHYPKKKGLLETIMSEGGPTTAVRWALYRFIREDFGRTLEFLAMKESAVVVE
ncbi:MAG: protease-4 [Candidatus Krumholzibacteriota bacterium]|nr:protease-4 [Candidatus Krumholzibacteriota bacterium]